MKALILSCNTGGGHNSCAAALKENFEERGDLCEIVDALGFISPGFSRFVSNWHSRIYRHLPWLFQFGYNYSEKHPAVFSPKSPIYRLLTRGKDALAQYLRDRDHDVIICTHVFAALMLTAALEEQPIQAATGFVNTDYTCSPITKNCRLERCFISDEALASEFECENIPREKIIGCGIPIRQAFCHRLNREEAKPRWGVPADHRHLLVACGSMGCGPIPRLTDTISRRMGERCDLTVVCGTNRRLYKKLEKKHAGDPRIHIRGYVDDMPSLMDSADLYLTKPGGISVSEAAEKELPMVLVNAVAGCEEPNLRYFLAAGGAATGGNVEELTAVCLELLSDDEKRSKMAAALAARAKCNAAQCICETMRAAAEPDKSNL